MSPGTPEQRVWQLTSAPLQVQVRPRLTAAGRAAAGNTETHQKHRLQRALSGSSVTRQRFHTDLSPQGARQVPRAQPLHAPGPPRPRCHHSPLPSGRPAATPQPLRRPVSPTPPPAPRGPIGCNEQRSSPPAARRLAQGSADRRKNAAAGVSAAAGRWLVSQNKGNGGQTGGKQEDGKGSCRQKQAQVSGDSPLWQAAPPGQPPLPACRGVSPSLRGAKAACPPLRASEGSLTKRTLQGGAEEIPVSSPLLLSAPLRRCKFWTRPASTNRRS